MVDDILALIKGSQDADVVFIPDDPEAYDSFAEDEADIHIAWTLGHVIVHTIASANESAALAAELARGVTFHGRSRYEVPWQTVTTIEECREYMEESRRIRLSSLGMWPDQPHLDNTYQPWEGSPVINPFGRFVYGLSHDHSHLKQIEDIVEQAKAART
jgi:hypothetical protein